MAAGGVLSTRVGRPAGGDFCDIETGAPTEEGLNLVRRAAGLGLSWESVAALMGTTTSTLRKRRQNFPELDESYQYGKAEADLAVSNALYKRCVAGDMAAIRWYEMTRTDRNTNVPVIEQNNTVFVVEAPPIQGEAEWEAQHSPVINGDSTRISAEG